MDRFVKRVFISQPTNELRSEEEIQKDRAHALMVARARIASEEFGEIETEVEALDDDFHDSIPHPPLYYLGHSILLMGQADIAVFTKGWMEDRKCRIERRVAREYRMKVIDLDPEG